ncbi:MAG: xanthine dehydrogenase family protein molybdopterin-binding subunit, partial [Kiloniellaceae bacterium]
MTDGSGMSAFDKPNSYIGRSVPRPNAKRLAQGRGTYVDDIELPRMLHLAFCRSPYAHAEIVSVDKSAAAALPGVVRVVTMEDLKDHCSPWVGVLDHLKGIKSAPQWPLANGKVFFQGEPVAAVVAPSRAIAGAAVGLVEIDYKDLAPVADLAPALDADTPVV